MATHLKPEFARYRPLKSAVSGKSQPGVYDPIPSPDVVERFSETSWELCENINAKHEAMFAETVPGEIPWLSDEPPSGPASLDIKPPGRAQPRLTVEIVMAEAKSNMRVCPRPEKWQQLYDMLPGKVRTSAGWRPSPPLNSEVCRSLPSLPKRLCLLEHIEWAAGQGFLEEVHAFLQKLTEEDWHHLGE